MTYNGKAKAFCMEHHRVEWWPERNEWVCTDLLHIGKFHCDPFRPGDFSVEGMQRALANAKCWYEVCEALNRPAEGVRRDARAWGLVRWGENTNKSPLPNHHLCLAGHDKTIVGVSGSGNCRACEKWGKGRRGPSAERVAMEKAYDMA